MTKKMISKVLAYKLIINNCCEQDLMVYATLSYKS